MKMQWSHRGVARALACAGVVFGVWHATALAVYLAPASPLKERHGRLPVAYINSLFRQNWHLFSPNPGTSFTRLEVRCPGATPGTAVWFDPAAGLQDAHDLLRVTGRGKVLAVYRGIGDALWDDMQTAIRRCAKARSMEGLPSEGLLSEARPEEGSALETESDRRLEKGFEACASVDTIRSAIEGRASYERARAYAERACGGTPTKAEAVEWRLVRVKPLPFSKRNDADAKRDAVVLAFQSSSPAKGAASHEKR